MYFSIYHINYNIFSFIKIKNNVIIITSNDYYIQQKIINLFLKSYYKNISQINLDRRIATIKLKKEINNDICTFDDIISNLFEEFHTEYNIKGERLKEEV